MLDGSLACIQSQEDEDLAALITPSGPLDMVWVGEYQWPIEPNIEFRPLYFNQDNINYSNPRDVAMGGQPGWGRCTNGETSNLTVIGSRTLHFQPNNWNGGEDCMARAASAGYLDNQCVEPYKCLCQWPGVTSDDFLEHGPVLTQRAKDAFSKQSDLFFLGITLSLVLGSIPAIIYMLVVEVWLIRYRQRTAASTQAEARLKIEQRRALRRRMLQSGLSLWIGFLLIACSIFPTVLNLRLLWPMYGFGTCPFGAFDYWSVLRLPGVAMVVLSILPSDSVAIRFTALAWSTYQFVDTIFIRWLEPLHGWSLEGGLDQPGNTVQVAGCVDPEEDCSFWIRLQSAWIFFRVVAGLVPLRAALFCSCGSGKWQIRPLPSRLALRQLWTCMRISFLLMAYDRVLYSYGIMKIADNPYSITLGVPALTEGIIIAVFAILMTAGVRRSETLPDLISFATPTCGSPLQVRRRIQALFAGCGAASRSSSSAAVITTMLGGDPVAALRSCNDLMRCIRISALTYEDIETNVAIGTDAAKLYGRTEKAGDGSVDAFLSHSWQDDAKLKWSKLNEFKQDFEASNDGAEPRCWLVRTRRFQSPHTPLLHAQNPLRPHTGQGLHRPERGHQREP